MKLRRICAAVLAMLLLSGCDYQAIVDDAMKELAHRMTEPEDLVEPLIGFTADETVEDVEQLEKPELEMLAAYESEFGQYNSRVYYEALNESERLVYHAYEYALDHSYPYIWIDRRLLENVNRETFDILWFFALDTPLMEQNLSHRRVDYTVTHSVFEIETGKEQYSRIYVDHFTTERLDRKLQAIAEAERILSEMPQGLTDGEKARYCYDYLGKNVDYKEKIDGDEYLYSALCLGKTNCDGYANAFSLLCSLSGLECFEKLSEPEDGSDGHTWNALLLDGSWVNVDATGAGEDVASDCEIQKEERIWFGFPDVLQTDLPIYQEAIPDCTQEIPSITRIPSGDVEDFVNRLKASFRANEGKTALVLVDEGDLENQITEDLATQLDCDLYYIYYETIEGKTAYYLFHDES